MHTHARRSLTYLLITLERGIGPALARGSLLFLRLTVMSDNLCVFVVSLLGYYALYVSHFSIIKALVPCSLFLVPCSTHTHTLCGEIVHFVMG